MAESSPPRFRKDLIATAVQADGVTYVDVRDPASGSSFRFYDFEHDLATQLDGRPLEAIAAWAATRYGLDLTADGIRVFAARLGELGFLEKAPQADVAEEVVFEFEDNPPVSELASRAVAGQVTTVETFGGAPAYVPKTLALSTGARPQPQVIRPRDAHAPAPTVELESGPDLRGR